MLTTYNDLYLDVRRLLKKEGVESAALEAREIVCCASNKTKEEFFRDQQLYASPEIAEQVADMLKRRLAGEPVAYLLGEWEFYGLPLVVDRNVLIPRDDTEVLAEQAITWAKTLEKGARVLDLCTGSGCIGLAVAAHAPDCFTVLADASPEALRIARANARINHLQTRTAVMQADALSGPPAGMDGFSCIVSNPPYIPTGDIAGLDVSVKDYEPHMALDGGGDGLDFYRAITEKWKEALLPGGKLMFELGIGQADDVFSLMQQEGFGDLELFEDTGGITRVIVGTNYTEV